MNYSADEQMVRVDFFKPNGKWYTTEAMKFIRYDGCIHAAFAESLRRHLGSRMQDMDAVCLEPCHGTAHPIMIKAGGWAITLGREAGEEE